MKTARKHTTLEEEEGGAGTYFVRSKEGVEDVSGLGAVCFMPSFVGV